MSETIISVRPLYLARQQAAAYLALSENTWDRLVARGEAPKPRKLSQGRVGWLIDDLDAWGRARPESDALPPPNSGYGRAGAPT